MKARTILASLAVFFAGLAIGLAADANPNMGTWKLNDKASKFAPGATRNTTVTYSAAPNDMIKVVTDGTDKDGKAVHTEWTGKFDGKDYPATGETVYDSRSYTKVDANTLSMTVKKAGKVVSSGKIVVAPDGKTRTVTTQSAANAAMNNVAVYDKQ